MINRRLLVYLLLGIIITTAGCTGTDQVQKKNVQQQVKQTTNQTDSGNVDGKGQVNDSQALDNPSPNSGEVEPGKSGVKPETKPKDPVIVKSTTNVSDEELKATYDEIDKELNGLIKELDKVDAPIDYSPTDS